MRLLPNRAAGDFLCVSLSRSASSSNTCSSAAMGNASSSRGSGSGRALWFESEMSTSRSKACMLGSRGIGAFGCGERDRHDRPNARRWTLADALGVAERTTRDALLNIGDWIPSKITLQGRGGGISRAKGPLSQPRRWGEQEASSLNFWWLCHVSGTRLGNRSMRAFGPLPRPYHPTHLALPSTPRNNSQGLHLKQ